MRLHAHQIFRRGLALSLAAILMFSPAFPGAAFAVLSAASNVKTGSFSKLPTGNLTEEQAILHVLNRLGFGPRPGEVGRLREIGIDRWIEQQLNPQSIDDSAVEARLKRYPTLTMSTAELFEKFPQPKVAAQQAGISRQEFQQAREQLQQNRQAKRDVKAGSGGMAGREADTEPEAGSMQEMDGAPGQTALPSQPPAPNGGNPQTAAQIRELLSSSNRPARIVAELAAAKLTRAVLSERQLNEVMVDFWFNHFNVFAGKGPERWLLTSYERDTIRPHALGKFEDLLIATAKSPAMLFYLDNWQSVDPNAADRIEQEMEQRRERLNRFGMLGVGRRVLPNFPRPPQNPSQSGQQKQKAKRGLNENYARELMELHTLGVDGGYTQKDVTEVARVFTGWTIRKPRQDPEFYFAPRLHDPGEKIVLGKKIRGNGMAEGEQVLRMLAHHPSTARFISTKLAERFVSDHPPQPLIDRMSATFLQTGGDIRAVLRTMIYSPEFWSPEAYRAKIKTPFELVASTARALGGQMEEPLPAVQWVQRIGQPLYQCQPPTGYSSNSEAWVNSGALLNRMNFALMAGQGSTANLLAQIGAASAADSPEALLARFIDLFLNGEVSPETRATLQAKLAEQMAQGAPGAGRSPVGLIAGLVLGSPEFQRR